jgi:lipopolysaccharide biosynthesis glycosyltransferase
MLMNLDHWRRHGHAATVVDYIRNNPDNISAWDQDGLNAVLHSQWLELHPRWNAQTILFEHEGRNLPVPADVLALCLARPAVIHYTAKFKPWHYWCEHPLKHEYYRYLAGTPWKNFRPREKTVSPLKNILRKFFRSV